MKRFHLFAGLFVVIALPLNLLAAALPWGLALAPVTLLLWLFLGYSYLCPRCGRHILENGRGYYAPWLKTTETCIGCGRRKDDVWPFQRWFRPEPNTPPT